MPRNLEPTDTAPHSWQRGDGYERYMGRWSRQLAPLFLRWLAAEPGRRWLDVGCGTGALSAAILDEGAPTSITGVDPSEGFLATAQSRLGERVAWHRAAAADLPLPDGSVDVVVSGLVLNFVPDVSAALREMVRVTADGGLVGACVWDYAGKMDLIRFYWQAVVELDATVQGQGERFPLCEPAALTTAFTGAGLHGVEVSAIELPMRFADFDDYWQPFLGGQGPAPAHAMSLGEATRNRLRELLRQRLPVQSDGTIQLAARAWAVRGTVAK
jgi:SAM-dependent methyltransferase